jgi:hypothetical protein
MSDVTSSGKPLQVLPWSEKIAKNREWFQHCADYYIGISRFYGRTRSNDSRDLKVLYDVYNAKFPADWFKQHTDPLSAKDEKHKQFPAKIRPVCILRTNLDLLMAEYPRRPFVFQVNNLSDDSYSRFQDELKKTVETNLMKRFKLQLTQTLMEQGLLTKDGQPASEEAAQQVQQQMASLDLPESIKEKFSTSYKDGVAIKGQKLLNRTLASSYFRQKLNKAFKHWVIVGETYSYKTVEFGEFIYKAVSPLMIDYDKSPEEDYIEDGEWVVYEEYITVSDAVDRFYDELKEENVQKMEQTTIYNSPTHLYDHLSSTLETSRGNKVRLLHVVWKGKKKWGMLTRANQETQQMEQIEVDEDYVVDSETETVEWHQANEVYETLKLSHDIYLRKRPVLFQRNSMANFSKTKLPYNGRKFSDTHSQNVSVMEIGLPLQIMYIIVTYTLEKTMAKSKGKIVLLDQNVIPRTPDGNDEEKFFYFTDALGYALINRNQIGVDKNYNQYQVLDMTLFDSIKQLIELQQHFKSEWDDLIGINRQRKGQTYASDLVGVNERATFQSTVITDMIFNLFEEFVERELQGVLDLTRFIAVDGIYKVWNETDLSTEILEIEPTEYCSADLGIMVQSSAEAMAIKNKLEGSVQAMLQNNVKPSTILSILKSQNAAELESKLKRIEELQAQAEQQTQQSQQEAEQQAQERREQFELYMETLKRETMHEEYDEKKELEHIKGTYNTFTFQDGDANDNGIPDAAEVAKLNLEREKLGSTLQDKREQRSHEAIQKEKDRQIKLTEMKSKEKIARSKPRPKA